MLSINHRRWWLALLSALAAAGCGSSTTHGSTSSGGAASSALSTGTPGASGASSPSALSGEAVSAATGDIPDNQVFLVFRDDRAGYSIKYPEGWTQQGSAGDVTFRDKNNLVHIFISHAAPPTPASVAAQLRGLKASTPTLQFTAPHVVQLGTASAIKATYSTRSAPNPVTGKRVTLKVDRYELARDGRVAVVDLGTPVGVDNIDAYRMMIDSFTWR